MEEKAKNTFLLLENDQIIGAVACYGNEIDESILQNVKFNWMSKVIEKI